MTSVGNSGGYLQGAASAVRQPVGASDASPYVPAAGVQAGAAAGGGLVDGGVPAGAIVGAAHAARNLDAAQDAANRPPVTTPVSVDGAASTQVAGPPAWSSAWAQKFLDAGVDAASVQQFTLTGANGADAAMLQTSLDGFVKSSTAQLEQFAAQHPHEYKDLRSIKSFSKGELLQVAMQANAGQLAGTKLDDAVQAAKSGTDLVGSTLKSLLPYSLIPAWGAIRFALSPLFGGHDPISGERIKLDFWNNGLAGWTDAAGAVAGAVTISNYARAAGQVVAGHQAIAAGGTAAKIAAAQGVDHLTGWQKALSYVPGTNSNRLVSGLAHIKDIEDGLAAMPAASTARKIGEEQLASATRGEVRIVATGASKFKFGLQSDTRGFLLNRGKELTSTSLTGRAPEISIDAYLKGKSSAAHFAGAAVDLSDSAVKTKLEAEIVAGMGGAPVNPKVLDRALRTQMAGTAAKELETAGYIQRPTSFFGKLRPGGMEDAFRAIDNLGTRKIGMARGAMPMFKALPGLGKLGVLAGVGAAIAGGGYLFAVKPALDAQKQAAAAAATGGGSAAGGATPAGQATPTGQLSPELQAALQQLAQSPPAQQKQELDNMQGVITRLSGMATRTAEQDQQLQQANTILPLMRQAIQGAPAAQAGQSVPQGGSQAPQSQAPQAQAPQSQPVGATG